MHSISLLIFFVPVKSKLMTRLFKCKNVPLENFLAKLWESRTTHALCISPVYETLIINLSEQYGDLVPVPSQSVILAGYFYYDLCERLVSHGRLIK
ncbi:separase, partial [Quercus suber]